MRKFIRGMIPVLMLFTLSKVSAQTQLFIKIIGSDGNMIQGEATIKGHENEIEAFSYGQDITNCCGELVGKTTIGKFIANIQLNKASNILKGILIKGLHLKSVEVTARKSGGSQVDYYKIKMEEVIISQMTEGQPDLTKIPQEQVSFNAARIGWTYYPQKNDGSPGTPVKFGWDIKKNIEWSGF